MAENEGPTACKTLAKSVSADEDGKESISVNQSQDSLSPASQLQQLQEAHASALEDHKNWMKDQLDRHSNDTRTMMKNEFGLLMEQERKSLIDGQQLREELNQLKLSLENDERGRLEGLRADTEQRFNTVSDSLEQNLETMRRNFSQQLDTVCQDQLERYSNETTMTMKKEFGLLMEEERKSLIDSQRFVVELNQLKLSLENAERDRLEGLRADTEQRLNTVSDSLEQNLETMRRNFSQQLDTVREDFSQQMVGLRGQLRTAQKVFVVGILIVLMAMILSGVDMKSWSSFSRAGEKGQLAVGFDRKAVLKHFKDGAAGLRSAFPSQSPRLWRVMESATLPIIEEDDPTHPAVILLVTTRDNLQVAECLAGRYASLVTESFNAATHATFNCEMHANSDPEEAKRQLDAVLSRAFDGGSKSGVVLRLEKLPGSAAMIFYRFADNDNAPYKHVAIILALESADTGSERDSVAYDELRKVWGSSLDTDKVEPLLSRIGNSVAFVRPETRDNLAANGC